MTLHVPIGFAEKLLNCEYHNYKHSSGAIVARTTEWSLPRHLHDHIDAIQPTTSFFRPLANAATYVDIPVDIPASYSPPTDDAISSVCNISSVSPECFAELYKTKGFKAVGGDNHVGFTNYLENEVPIRPDTKLFLEKYRPEAVETADTYTQVSIAGGPVQDGPLNATQAEDQWSVEANLDVQAIAGISWPIPIESWSTGGQPPFTPDLNTPENTNEPYLVWVNWLLAQDSFPQVISSSYGDDEQSVPESYAKRVCKQFAQVGARGTTLFFSSGDRGVGFPDTCYSNDGKNTSTFLPAFPAGCPYVTAVGGVMNFEPEVPVYRPAGIYNGVQKSLYAGGSGFSNYFSRPAWQDAVVPDYVKGLNGSYDGLYNKGKTPPPSATLGFKPS